MLSVHKNYINSFAKSLRPNHFILPACGKAMALRNMDHVYQRNHITWDFSFAIRKRRKSNLRIPGNLNDFVGPVHRYPVFIVALKYMHETTRL